MFLYRLNLGWHLHGYVSLRGVTLRFQPVCPRHIFMRRCGMLVAVSIAPVAVDGTVVEAIFYCVTSLGATEASRVLPLFLSDELTRCP